MRDGWLTRAPRRAQASNLTLRAGLNCSTARYHPRMRNYLSLLAALALVATLCLLATPRPAHANGYDFYPAPLAWSPDSSMLLAAWSMQFPLGEGAIGDDMGELRLYWPASSRQVVVDWQAAVSPCWHPDGRSFAAVLGGSLRYYLIDPHDAFGKPICFGALSPRRDVLDCAFGPPRASQPGPPASLFDPRNAGNAPTLYYSAGERFYGCGIFAWDPPLAERTVATLGGGSALAPLGLPDGRLVFLGQGGMDTPSGSYERLMIQAADGRELRQLTQPALGPPISPGEYHESYALLMPGGNEILFQRGGWGDWSLYTINLSSGVEKLLLADAQQPSLSLDGRRLLFTRRDPAQKALAEYDWELPSTVWLKDLQSGAEQQLSTDGYYAEGPAISPDGCWAAWLESPLQELPAPPLLSKDPEGGWPPPYPAVMTRELSEMLIRP